MKRVLLDLSSTAFQRVWFTLPRDEQLLINGTFAKLLQLTWDQVYKDRGLRWEKIRGRTTDSGDSLYSLRVSQKIRVLAVREGDWLRVISLHPDHDSAYE